MVRTEWGEGMDDRGDHPDPKGHGVNEVERRPQVRWAPRAESVDSAPELRLTPVGLETIEMNAPSTLSTSRPDPSLRPQNHSTALPTFSLHFHCRVISPGSGAGIVHGPGLDRLLIECRTFLRPSPCPHRLIVSSSTYLHEHLEIYLTGDLVSPCPLSSAKIIA